MRNPWEGVALARASDVGLKGARISPELLGRGAKPRGVVTPFGPWLRQVISSPSEVHNPLPDDRSDHDGQHQ